MQILEEQPCGHDWAIKKCKLDIVNFLSILTHKFSTYIQWNPVNTTTFGPWKFGCINGVVVLMGYGQIMVQNAFTTFYYMYTFNPLQINLFAVN